MTQATEFFKSITTREWINIVQIFLMLSCTITIIFYINAINKDKIKFEKKFESWLAENTTVAWGGSYLFRFDKSDRLYSKSELMEFFKNTP